MTGTGVPTAAAARPPEPGRSAGRMAWRLGALWNGLTGAIGLIMGLVPHVLHHIGLLAGAAAVTGAAGATVFGVVGLVASTPLLLRLRRRFGTWLAPTIGLAVFAVMFALSTFVIGPAISGRRR